MASNGSSVSRQAAPACASNHQIATNGNGPPPPPPPPSPPRGAIFILYNLHCVFEDDMSEVQGIHEEREHIAQTIAETCRLAALTVLRSSLNQAGLVQALYLNVWERGCFQVLNPQADFFQDISPTQFSNEAIWLEVPDILSNLPTIRNIIGCVSGDVHQNCTDFREYIADASDDSTFVILVGDFEDGVFQGSINDYVKISNFSLTADTILSRMCNALERKWNIN